MGYFQVEITFPARLIHPEVNQHLEEMEFYDSGKENYYDKVSLLKNCYADKDNKFYMIEDSESGDGEIQGLEKLLKKHNIPYDRDCSSDDGYAADTMYFRPGVEDHIVKKSEGHEYIKVEDITNILTLPDHLLRIEIDKLLDINSSENVEPLETYTTETQLGQNKTAMERIDEVLAQLDAEEITQTEAFAQIAKIKEEENNDED